MPRVAVMRTVPGIDGLADLELLDWGLVPASQLSFDQVLDIGQAIDRQLRRPEIDGAVVVQGTDNMEETSFAWDLLPLPHKPVVVWERCARRRKRATTAPRTSAMQSRAAAHGMATKSLTTPRGSETEAQ